MNVLVIEDDEFYSVFLKSKLGQEFPDDNFKFANSGLSALEEVSNNIDVVIIDFMLGDTLGTSLIRQIRKKNINTEFIMITATPSIELEEIVDKINIFNYIKKDGKELDKLIQSLKTLFYLIKINENLNKML